VSYTRNIGHKRPDYCICILNVFTSVACCRLMNGDDDDDDDDDGITGIGDKNLSDLMA